MSKAKRGSDTELCFIGSPAHFFAGPSKDVLWTTEVQPTLTSGAGCGGDFPLAQHYTAELDVVLAVFSTGPVGIGDALNYTNATRARAAATADGTLLQPDKPLTPLDWTLWPDLATPLIQFEDCTGGAFPCRPQLLQTHTALVAADGETRLQWHHVVAVAVRAYPLSIADFWPALPLPTNWSYAIVRRTGLGHACHDGAPAFAPGGCATSSVCPGPGGGICLPVADTGVGFWDAANLHLAWALYLFAPRTPDGWALFGELDKYNPAAAARLASVDLAPAGGGLAVLVTGAPGETVSLYAIDPDGVVRKRSCEIGVADACTVFFTVPQ